MKAAFQTAAVYLVEAQCVSPFRSGGSSNNTEHLLLNSHGVPMLQGASIAGAMRGQCSPTDGAKMFGEQAKSGCLVVSDGVFSSYNMDVIRPRLRIDRRTGTAADCAKYDVRCIDRGAKFTFKVTCFTDSDGAAEHALTEQIFGQLHSGLVRLGGEKTNGFGKVRLQVRKKVYHMRDAIQRKAWLEDDFSDAKTITLSTVNNSKYTEFILTGILPSVLVRSSQTITISEETDEGKPVDTTVTPNLFSGDKAVIPASSVKGVLRSQCEAICKFMGKDEALVNRLFGCADKKGENTTEKNENKGFAGMVQVDEVLLHKSHENYKIIRIRIDRFTGGVIPSALFTDQPAGGNVTLKVTLTKQDNAAAGLLFYALRDLASGRVALGSGGSIGRGFLCNSKLQINCHKGKANITFGDVITAEDPNNIIVEYLEAYGQEVCSE